MPAPPTGTVTFLFTDIEGSTQRWEKFPEAMATVIARHDDLLRSIIQKSGGTVFKTVGDSVCAVFSSALEGVEAALEAQRAIQNEDWGEVGLIKVRMALHTGVAQERNADYFGPSVNRVARIMAAGHGGQILLSEVTRQLLQGDEPADVELRNFGVHRLKDLTHAEQIFGLLAPGLDKEFPPLRSLDRQWHNLPIPPTPLIGRDNEVAAVLVLLREPTVRLVTLSGPGGTGKTRLSMQIALDGLPDFKDGVFFVSLANAKETEEIVAGICHAMALKEIPDASPLESLVGHLRHLNVLLVLDNFEQVTSSANMVADLLATCPRLKFLITSQSVLKLRGEHEFPVPPLAVPPRKLPPLDELARFPAIELFVARATAAKPGFELTRDNAVAVAEICRRLEGLPLGLELAAARIKLLAPQAMLGHLENRLKFLTGGARDLPHRQQTLRNAIAWSHDLLEEEEKVLFRRLGVFREGFTLEAALGVAEFPQGPETDVFNGVEALVDKSLLRHIDNGVDHGEEPRFSMLEYIRDLSVEELEKSGEAQGAAQRHADFYGQWMADLARQAKADPSLSLDNCEIEHENLRSALQWQLKHDPTAATSLTLALVFYWERQGHFREARETLARCLEVSSESKPHAQLLEQLGWFHFLSGDYSSARRIIDECLEWSRSHNEKEVEADALNDLALIAQAQGDQEMARDYLLESLALVRAANDRPRQATRLGNLGLLSVELGQFSEAAQYLAEANTIYEALGDLRGTAACLCNRSELELRRGDYAQAAELAQRGLELFRQLKDRRGVALTLTNYGEAEVLSGKWHKAMPSLEEALTIAVDTDMRWLLPFLLEKLAQSYEAGGGIRRAYLSLLAAGNLREQFQQPRSADEAEKLTAVEKRLSMALGEETSLLKISLANLSVEATIVQIVEFTEATF